MVSNHVSNPKLGNGWQRCKQTSADLVYYQEGEQLIAYNRNISGIILSTMHNAELRKDCGLIVSVQNKPNAP